MTDANSTFKRPSLATLTVMAIDAKNRFIANHDRGDFAIYHALAWAIGERADPPLLDTGISNSPYLPTPPKTASNNAGETDECPTSKPISKDHHRRN